MAVTKLPGQPAPAAPVIHIRRLAPLPTLVSPAQPTEPPAVPNEPAEWMPPKPASMPPGVQFFEGLLSEVKQSETPAGLASPPGDSTRPQDQE